MRLFRERGFDAVSVAEVMTAAGLTHGGFYGHFRSKDDLAAQASARAAAGDPAAPPRSLSDHAARYLRPAHRDARAEGCAFAALGSEAARQSPAVRRATAEGLVTKLDALTEAAPGASRAARRQAAVAAFAGMVGALVLARMVDDTTLSDEILDETRAALTEGYGAAPPAPRGD